MDVVGYQIQYTLIQAVASLLWLINQGLLAIAVAAYIVQQAIININDPTHPGFVMQILDAMLTGSGGEALRALLLATLFVAVIVLGLTLILRPILRVDLVSPKRVLLWLMAAGILFATGSGFFLGLETLRGGLLTGVGQVIRTAGAHTTLPESVSIPTNLPNQMGEQWHHFGDIVPPSAPGPGRNTVPPVNGLDLVMSYLFIYTDTEVTNEVGGDPLHYYMPLHLTRRSDSNCNDCQPATGYAGYFYWDMSARNNDLGDNAHRQAAVDAAIEGMKRLAQAIPLSLYALVEALCYLAFTLAAALLFLSVPLGLVFALFQPTEIILIGLFKKYLELAYRGYGAIAFLNMFLVLQLVAAQSGNALLFAIIMALSLGVAWQLLNGAKQTVQQAFDTLSGGLHGAWGTTPARSPVGIGPQGFRWQGGGAGAVQAVQGLGSTARSIGGVAGRVAGGIAGGPVGIAAATVGYRGKTAIGHGLSGIAAKTDNPSRVDAARAVTVDGDEAAGATGSDSRRGEGGARGPQSRARVGEAGGQIWAHPGHAQAARTAVQAVVATPDAQQRQRLLARVPLAPADQAAFGQIVEADPNTARAVLTAVEAVRTTRAPAEAAFTAAGQLTLASAGMQAVRHHLAAGPTDSGQVDRLFTTPAGQAQLRVLVGAGLGLERQWDDGALLGALGATASDPSRPASVTALTRRMGVGPDTFGGTTGTLDRLLGDLQDLGLTAAQTADLIRVGRELHRVVPFSDTSAAARKKFAHNRGSAVSGTLGRLTTAVQQQALRQGQTDPALVERHIQQILRDTARVPKQIYAPQIPLLAAGGRSPDAGAAVRPAAPARDSAGETTTTLDETLLAGSSGEPAAPLPGVLAESPVGSDAALPGVAVAIPPPLGAPPPWEPASHLRRRAGAHRRIPHGTLGTLPRSGSSVPAFQRMRPLPVVRSRSGSSAPAFQRMRPLPVVRSGGMRPNSSLSAGYRQDSTGIYVPMTYAGKTAHPAAGQTPAGVLLPRTPEVPAQMRAWSEAAAGAPLNGVTPVAPSVAGDIVDQPAPDLRDEGDDRL